MIILSAVIGIIFSAAAYTVIRNGRRERFDIDAGALEGDLTSFVKSDLNEGRGPRH